MTKNLWLSLATVSLLFTAGCGGASTTNNMSPPSEPDLGPGPSGDLGPAPEGSCADLGGQCVAVVPGACADGKALGADKCGGGIGVTCCIPGATPDTTCTPLPTSGGSANPASAYCGSLGYGNTGDGKCALPNSVVCEEWAFYRGECGQGYSFCEKHGGTLTNETKVVGSSTQSYGLCTLPSGKKCSEEEFSHTCDCQ